MRETRSGLVPEQAIYRLSLDMEQAYTPQQPRQLRGRVVIYGKPEAYLSEFIRSVAAVLLREAGF